MVLGRHGDAVALVALEDGEVDHVLGVDHGLQEVVLIRAGGLAGGALQYSGTVLLVALVRPNVPHASR